MEWKGHEVTIYRIYIHAGNQGALIHSWWLMHEYINACTNVWLKEGRKEARVDGWNIIHHHTKVEWEWQELRNRYPENPGHWPPKSTLDCPELVCGSCPSTLQSPARMYQWWTTIGGVHAKEGMPMRLCTWGPHTWILQYAWDHCMPAWYMCHEKSEAL